MSDESALHEAPRWCGSLNSRRQRRVLDWRMDPEESRSDFVMEIVSSSNDDEYAPPKEVAAGANNMNSYHLHKNILEFGERASGYFGGLFASDTTESNCNQTRISLPKTAAKAFPLLLDYMYGLHKGKIELTIENAAPLYHLADYFEVESLHQIIVEFWKETIQAQDLGHCLEQATMLKIDVLRDEVVKKCSENIADIAIDSLLMDVCDAEFWIEVESEMGDEFHPHFISLVAEFCLKRKDSLTAEVFDSLSSACCYTFFPQPLEAAMKFLEAEVAIDPDCNGDNELTGLQIECIGSLVFNWKKFSENTAMRTKLREFSSFLQSTVLEKCLEQNREESEAWASLLDNAADGLPTSITVEGAEVAAMNGLYVRCVPFHPTDPQYCKDGVWEGIQAEFFILMENLGPTEESVWFISVKNKEGEGSDVCTDDVYTAFPFSSHRLWSLPRMGGWVVCQAYAGVYDSTPSLTYNVD